MAQIESDIYARMALPDPNGPSNAFAGGLKMGDMMRQKTAEDKKLAYDDALKSSYKTGDDGRLTLDKTRLSALAGMDPQRTMELQLGMDTDSAALQKQKQEKFLSDADLTARLANGVSDQASYDQARQMGHKLGLNYVDTLPDQYDPKLVEQIRGNALSAKDKFEQDYKGQEMGIKQGQLAVSQGELGVKNKEVGLKHEDNALRRNEQQMYKQGNVLNQTQSLLESARGNPEVSQALKDRYAAGKLNGLLGDDPNKLSPQMVQLAASEVAKIATGGVPQSSELQHLTPSSIPGDLAKATQYFTNSPSATNQGEFMKQYQKYANDLAGGANAVIKDKYGRVIESRKRLLNPADYDTLVSQYLEPFEKQGKAMPAAQAHPQDNEAVAWAKANSADPRAAQILKMNGVQ